MTLSFPIQIFNSFEPFCAKSSTNVELERPKASSHAWDWEKKKALTFIPYEFRPEMRFA